MSDLGQAYVQIIPKATGISNKISNLIAPGSQSAGQAAGTTIASGIKKALIAAGIGAAIVGVVKGAVSEAGKLQQSFGGLKTIYGDASDQAIRFAKNASRMGVSANQYAEQAVSFGAALKQAYGGDTTKAMKAANTAIMDMTDNAAKMGTPLQSIQDAYQGFAKQNYTMLDNLKLGYGGTKTEMERLLADAEKLTGVKYDINNLGDVYDAIHAVQQELGLTGVAAEEAKTTFTGSFEAMKAAWKNFLGELALGDATNIAESMADLVEYAGTFLFDNLIPLVVNVMRALPGAIKTGIEIAGPKLLDAGKDLLTWLKNGIAQNAPKISEAIPAITEKIKSGIDTYAPLLLEKGKDILVHIGEGIKTYAPDIISAIGEAISSLVDYISERMPEFASKAGEMVQTLATSLIEHIPDLAQALIAFQNWFRENSNKIALAFLQLGGELVLGLVQGILQGVANLVGPAAQQLVEAIKQPIEALKGFFSGVWSSITSAASAAWNALKGMASAVWNAIKTAVTSPITALQGALSAAWGAIRGAASAAWNGIKTAIMTPIQAAKDKVKSIMDSIKSIFPLHIGKIFSGLKLPRISVSGGSPPFGIAGKGSLPKFSVTWAAQGGIVDGATLIGAGEAGSEAIVPLDPFWERMDRIREEIANRDSERLDAALDRIISVLEYIATTDTSIKWNQREVGRLVKEVM